MKRKCKILVITSLVMVCMAVGGLATYALLHSVTDTAANVFASERNIKIQLSEPEWEDHGKAEAQSYVPGQIIDKDPTVTLEKESVAAYVAVKVQYFELKDGKEQKMSYDEFKEKFLDETNPIDFSDDWEFISNNENSSYIYMYKKILLQDNPVTQDTLENVTTPLFNNVHISSEIEADSETKLLPKFNIKVTAYAIQADGINETEAAEQLTKIIK